MSLDNLDLSALALWLEEAIQHYTTNQEDRFSRFYPLIIMSDEDIPLVVLHYYNTTSAINRDRFRKALAMVAERIPPTSSWYFASFANLCNIAAYVRAPEALSAIRDALFHGSLSRTNNRAAWEAIVFAIDAVTAVSPPSADGIRLLREMYATPRLRNAFPRTFLIGMSRADPDRWPAFFSAFSNSPDFEEIMERNRMRSLLEELIHTVGISQFALRLHELFYTDYAEPQRNDKLIWIALRNYFNTSSSKYEISYRYKSVSTLQARTQPSEAFSEEIILLVPRDLLAEREEMIDKPVVEEVVRPSRPRAAASNIAAFNHIFEQSRTIYLQ